MPYKTRQIIEIDVTWTGYKSLALKWLLRKLAEQDDLDIERINLREIKRK